MELKEIYDMMPGDYEDAVERLAKEDRIKKYLIKFKEQETVYKLEKALNEKNAEEAFLQAHSLKGVCANLSITSLYNSASNLTENLRDRIIDENDMPLFDKVKADYDKVMAALSDIN